MNISQRQLREDGCLDFVPIWGGNKCRRSGVRNDNALVVCVGRHDSIQSSILFPTYYSRKSILLQIFGANKMGNRRRRDERENLAKTACIC